MNIFSTAVILLLISIFGCDAYLLPGEQCIIGPYIPGQRLGRYIYHTDIKTWEEAIVICALEGAHLAIVNSAEEENGIKNLLQGRISLLGIHDVNREGVFETVEGDLVYGMYNNWNSGEPNNVGNEDCGLLLKTGKVNDLKCNYRRSFLCEKYENDCTNPNTCCESYH